MFFVNYKNKTETKQSVKNYLYKKHTSQKKHRFLSILIKTYEFTKDL